MSEKNKYYIEINFTKQGEVSHAFENAEINGHLVSNFRISSSKQQPYAEREVQKLEDLVEEMLHGTFRLNDMKNDSAIVLQGNNMLELFFKGAAYLARMKNGALVVTNELPKSENVRSVIKITDGHMIGKNNCLHQIRD